MYVPTMIFGHLLTSSNYDDSEKKVTGLTHGLLFKMQTKFSFKRMHLTWVPQGQENLKNRKAFSSKRILVRLESWGK